MASPSYIPIHPDHKLPLLKTVTHVHIIGRPFIWLIQRIVQQAPHITTLRLSPCFHNATSRLMQRIIRRARVKLEFGTLHPAKTKRHSPPKTPSFFAQRLFLQTLSAEGAAKWHALNEERHPCIQPMIHYFGINGVPKLTLSGLAKKMGKNNPSHIHTIILGTLTYLGYRQSTAISARRYARSLERRHRRSKIKKQRA